MSNRFRLSCRIGRFAIKVGNVGSGRRGIGGGYAQGSAFSIHRCCCRLCGLVSQSGRLNENAVHHYLLHSKIKMDRIHFKIKVTNIGIIWHVKVQQLAIKRKKRFRYLRIELNSRLLSHANVILLLLRGNATFRAIYSFLMRRSRLRLDLKLLLYKKVIRPAITYGAPSNQVNREYLHACMMDLSNRFFDFAIRASTLTTNIADIRAGAERYI